MSYFSTSKAMFSHNCGNAWKKIRRGNSIYLISPSWDILKTNMICGIFMTKERIVEMNIARFSEENICQTDWSGERRIPTHPHTQKAKKGELWNRKSVEEFFSSDSKDNFEKELWNKHYELFHTGWFFDWPRKVSWGSNIHTGVLHDT